jgi:hypothetical protein
MGDAADNPLGHFGQNFLRSPGFSESLRPNLAAIALLIVTVAYRHRMGGSL